MNTEKLLQSQLGRVMEKRQELIVASWKTRTPAKARGNTTPKGFIPTLAHLVRNS